MNKLPNLFESHGQYLQMRRLGCLRYGLCHVWNSAIRWYTIWLIEKQSRNANKPTKPLQIMISLQNRNMLYGPLLIPFLSSLFPTMVWHEFISYWKELRKYNTPYSFLFKGKSVVPVLFEESSIVLTCSLSCLTYTKKWGIYGLWKSGCNFDFIQEGTFISQ